MEVHESAPLPAGGEEKQSLQEKPEEKAAKRIKHESLLTEAEPSFIAFSQTQNTPLTTVSVETGARSQVGPPKPEVRKKYIAEWKERFGAAAVTFVAVTLSIILLYAAYHAYKVIGVPF